MKFARRFLIFSYGLFTIAAQTLLFREFLTSFEGNDISVGIFFASWFLWVGLSAIVVYRLRAFTEILVNRIEFLLLCYLPAFILQSVLIIQARQIAGAEHFALLPMRTIVLLSIIVNAPVSIITGILFPTACRWVRQEEEMAVSRVYILEAAGSFAGGLGTTLLLAFGAGSVRLSLIIAFIVALSAALVKLAKIKEQLPHTSESQRFKHLWICRFAAQMLVFSLPVLLILGLVNGIDQNISRHIRSLKWTLPVSKKEPVGSFYTAQAEYLYGSYGGQWIVYRQGSFIESLPEQSNTGKTAAIALCQRPDAEKILVVGSGLDLCQQFLKLEHIEKVTWANNDNEYIGKLNKVLPNELRVTDERLEPIFSDIRSFLTSNKQAYDIIIVNLPNATSSSLNRYFTYQFYQQVKGSLRADGVFTIRIAGGENILGTELVSLGASTKFTLQKVFSNLELVPGEDTWFIASDAEDITGNPGTLKDRLSKIPGASEILPPDALFSLYLPERAEKAMTAYDNTDLPQQLLINQDSRPLTHLYNLLLTAKQSGATVTKFVRHLALAGPLVFFVPIFILMALRALYLLSARGKNEIQKQHKPSFDSTFLAFSSGLLGIGVVIVLMYLYQTRFGSLYLHIGVISSVFMLGMTTGAASARRLLSKAKTNKLESILIAVISIHTLLLAAIAYWPFSQYRFGPNSASSIFEPMHLIFAAAFLLCGLCAGCYFPIAARKLADADFETGQAGSKLETADHLGACAGGLLTSLLLVPVLGTKPAVFVFILLLLANIPAAVMKLYKPEIIYRRAKTANLPLTIGYFLFGIGISVVICSNIISTKGISTKTFQQYQAHFLAEQLQVKPMSKTIDDITIDYFIIYESTDKLKGYIFNSGQLADEVQGYGGRINLAVYTDTTGKLIDFQILGSNETPRYLERVMTNKKLLKGRGLLAAEPFAGINSVTGATISYKAITSALQLSTNRFFDKVVAKEVQTAGKEKTGRLAYDKAGIYLIIAFILSLIVIYFGGFWSRFFVLCFNLIAGGLLLNSQFSSWHVTTLLSMKLPSPALSGAFLLILGIPVLVLIFGNIYCGYLCPFGALQELINYLRPKKLRPLIPAKTLRTAAFFKYIILFIIITAFFIWRKQDTLKTDVLIGIFTAMDGALFLVIAIIAIAGAFFYTRFWCRYLCPAGAFLALLNKIAILKKYLPAKRYGRCDFGLTAEEHSDCIHCDRCRYVIKTPSDKLFGASSDLINQSLARYFLPIVAAATIFLSAATIKIALKNIPESYSQPETITSTGTGRARDVDIEQIQKMIQENKLSDKEAEYYKKIE